MLAAILALIVCTGCENPFAGKKEYAPSYSNDSSRRTLVTLALPNPGYYKQAAPFVTYLNERLKNIRVRAIAGNNYDEYLERLGRKEFDLTILNGVLALEQEQQGYRIFGRVFDTDSYRGVVLVHRDSAIQDYADLKGRTISSPGDEALAGHQMPLYHLYQNGLHPGNYRVLSLGSFESAYLNIYHGKCSAGFGWLTSWEKFIEARPEILSRVQLKWTTAPQLNVALIARKDLDPGFADELNRVIFSMHETEEGKKVLQGFGFDKFVPANAQTYAPLEKFRQAYLSIRP
jgi:phosphonate transport system substrate-binding protein